MAAERQEPRTYQMDARGSDIFLDFLLYTLYYVLFCVLSLFLCCFFFLSFPFFFLSFFLLLFSFSLVSALKRIHFGCLVWPWTEKHMHS